MLFAQCHVRVCPAAEMKSANLGTVIWKCRRSGRRQRQKSECPQGHRRKSREGSGAAIKEESRSGRRPRPGASAKFREGRSLAVNIDLLRDAS